MELVTVDGFLWWLGAIYGSLFAVAGVALLLYAAVWLWWHTMIYFIPMVRIQRIVEHHRRRARRLARAKRKAQQERGG